MRRAYILCIGILLLVGTASALNPVNVAITSSSAWVTADNLDSSFITVSVTDGTNKAIGGASIQLSVASPWALQDAAGVTPAGGQFTTRFLPTTTAGAAVITAVVIAPTNSVDGAQAVTVIQTFTQNVTASTPAVATRSFPTSGSVGSIADITLRVTDANGNPVNSRKVRNVVSFATTLLGDNGFTASGSKTKAKAVSVALNDTGYADIAFTLNSNPGDNYVVITPPFPLGMAIIDIQGVANLPAASISATVSPAGNPPTLTTDGISKFNITYQLTDQFGNPSTYRNLTIYSSAGETRLVMSNNQGKVAISYGPKTGPGRYTLTAVATDNTKISNQLVVQFVSGKPTGISFTASPQTMASHEVDPSAKAYLMAKVVDSLGNPVPKQPVYFSIQSVSTGSYNQVSSPSIQGTGTATSVVQQEVSAVTDETGYALGTFIPGSFTADTTNGQFSLMAQGTAKVRARWSNKYVDLNLSYKNYPYLSVFTSVSPPTTSTNGTVDVSVQVKGDGYALKPKPVDSYMVTDRSQSMSSGTPTRMSLVKNAAMAFMGQFDYTVDNLGQFSFSDDVSQDLALSNQPAQISGAIQALSPSGHTALRLALYQAITALKNDPNTGSVKGIVVLSDGDYNVYGDPLARGEGKTASARDPTDSTYYYDDTQYWTMFTPSNIPQNMSEYARQNNIRIYAIGYSSSMTTTGQQTLRTIAESTYGKYYYALTQDDLVNFYGQIAGALKDTAGVNTTLTLDFSSVNVNNLPVTPGSAALQYQYIDGRSTQVVHPDGTWETKDSTPDWKTGKINVTLGTIRVNDLWMVNFTLNAIMAGNIQVIGSSSKAYFNDNQGNPASVPAPDTFVTAIPGGTDKGVTTPVFAITDLQRANSQNDRDTAIFIWNLNYTGTDSRYEEDIDIAPLNSEAYMSRGTTYAQNGDKSGSYSLRISDLNPGMYKMRVTGFPSDAPSASNITQFTIDGTAPNPSIVIH
ncbi:MAG TPA: VWA domain-containing protein [Methanomicrobiales archaeon]|nr:VWA domain-containing protein [Methanomicrobiales archaeon]